MNPQQIKIMLDLQNSMNTKVNANWQAQGYEWYRAIWVECAELLDHYGWKWWKKQSPDTEQVALELIDIWHFGLSILLQSGTKPELIIAQIQNQLVIATDEQDFPERDRVDARSTYSGPGATPSPLSVSSIQKSYSTPSVPSS